MATYCPKCGHALLPATEDEEEVFEELFRRGDIIFSDNHFSSESKMLFSEEETFHKEPMPCAPAPEMRDFDKKPLQQATPGSRFIRLPILILLIIVLALIFINLFMH